MFVYTWREFVKLAKGKSGVSQPDWGELWVVPQNSPESVINFKDKK